MRLFHWLMRLLNRKRVITKYVVAPGNLRDPSCWSLESGGRPGADPPRTGERAVLDENTPMGSYRI